MTERRIDRPLKLQKPRQPIRKRRPGVRRGRTRDKNFLAFVKSLPCVVCEKVMDELVAAGFPREMLSQESRTEAAHVGQHSMDQKTDDENACPLCRVEHHQFGPESLHKLGPGFWAHHGIDWPELRAALHRRYDALG